jgi:ribosomal protein S18 acetylase RimI-like enzyme
VINIDIDIKNAEQEDQESILASMTFAFVQDPVFRWIYPEPQKYLAGIRGYVQAFGGRAFLHNTAYYIGDFFGAALWLPPGILPDDEGVLSAFDKNVSKERIGRVHELIEQMGEFHPTEPVWHLAVLGVDKAHQRKGMGGALLRHTLELIDKEESVVYLEASSSESVSLYRRYGFEAIGTIRIQDIPPVTPMIRYPT